MLPEKLRYLGKSRLTTMGTLLSTGLLLVVLSVGLVACGSTTGGAANPTPTVSTQTQHCGAVQTNPKGLPLNAAAAKLAADCFWQADQKCQPATLTYTRTGVDTIATHTFTIGNNGERCSVSDTVKHAIIPAPLSAAQTYTCSGVTQQADGLHFSACGNEGDLVVPAGQ